MALESMLVAFAGAICVDILLGDPRNKFHPVAWLGYVIRYFVPKLKQNNSDTNSKNNIKDTTNLDEQHIISGTIESISENIVDGITSPLFYYSFLGPAGAFSFRIINTLDSMLGYTDKYHKDIGWMPALLDTVANYIPARITAIMMVIAARIVHADWKKSIQILRRDHGKTSSFNSGYPMSTMAGALRINLEKIGYYSLGDQCECASIEKCKVAISIMKYTAVAFCMVFSAPLITMLFVLG